VILKTHTGSHELAQGFSVAICLPTISPMKVIPLACSSPAYIPPKLIFGSFSEPVCADQSTFKKCQFVGKVGIFGRLATSALRGGGNHAGFKPAINTAQRFGFQFSGALLSLQSV
jgi:hypothetical protein